MASPYCVLRRKGVLDWRAAVAVLDENGTASAIDLAGLTPIDQLSHHLHLAFLPIEGHYRLSVEIIKWTVPTTMPVSPTGHHP